MFAESGGFEPPERYPVRQFSKLLVSATHPTFLTELLLKKQCKNINFFVISNGIPIFLCKIVHSCPFSMDVYGFLASVFMK